jgi:hypothetical protein
MTKKEYYKLVDDLIRYSDSYYKNNKSLISDKEFDILLKKAEAFEAEHPDWARPDSPTQGVGSDLDGAVSLEHTRPMLSLENTYNKEEVRAWFDKMTRHGVKATASPQGTSRASSSRGSPAETARSERTSPRISCSSRRSTESQSRSPERCAARSS